MRAICEESIKAKPNGTWNLEDDLCVIDDDWQDAYGSAAELTLKLHHNPQSPEAAAPWETIRDEIAPMVQSLNYFSLPTILMIAYLMCTKLGDTKVTHVPASFLGGCLEVSRAESEISPRHVWLTNLLEGLYEFARRDNDVESLKEVLNLTIPCYVQLVSDCGNPDGATALSLLSFYHTQLGTGAFWLEKALEKIMRLLPRVEAAKGQDDRATLEVPGFAILVLSETNQPKRLMLEANKMRQRTKRQLKKLPKDHPDRDYYLDRLLDGYHLQTRLALETPGQEEYAKELQGDYEARLKKEGKDKDNFAKNLDLELENVTSRLESTTLGSE
ncbi:hypothetical protein QBC37DRAFT_432186 [Rhypophila decipiens]|uniref:Uncharacterized protein n=1 Tax=Rhypophila decipiens TaxID=261697 RepID=A0AAN6Y1A3_9PEZI|nr:hypothetical protein QBC37DRAFT_432186 [Rhypophila decipiens]